MQWLNSAKRLRFCKLLNVFARRKSAMTRFKGSFIHSFIHYANQFELLEHLNANEKLLITVFFAADV